MYKALHGLRIAACTLALAAGSAVAAFPEKPIRMVVISAPGGTTDIMSRLLAQAMGEGLGQQVVIDNRPGGGGLISAEIVAGAGPDGHTVLYTHTSFSVMPSLHKTLPYDTVKSFERVSVFALFPGVLLVNNNLPIKNVQELCQSTTRQGQLRGGYDRRDRPSLGRAAEIDGQDQYRARAL